MHETLGKHAIKISYPITFPSLFNHDGKGREDGGRGSIYIWNLWLSNIHHREGAKKSFCPQSSYFLSFSPPPFMSTSKRYPTLFSLIQTSLMHLCLQVEELENFKEKHSKSLKSIRKALILLAYFLILLYAVLKLLRIWLVSLVSYWWKTKKIECVSQVSELAMINLFGFELVNIMMLVHDLRVSKECSILGNNEE